MPSELLAKEPPLRIRLGPITVNVTPRNAIWSNDDIKDLVQKVREADANEIAQRLKDRLDDVSFARVMQVLT